VNGTLGVLGGMGPLASARFVYNLYELNPARREQDLPRVLLDSDPELPDRTAAIMNGTGDVVRQRLASRVVGLLDLGATRIVVPCVTAHHFIGLMDPALRAPVVSLVDVTVSQLAQAPEPLLMLSTTGTRRARIFERAPGWPSVANRVVLPSRADQELIHQLIYQLKWKGAAAGALPIIEALRRRYGCAGVIVGCTEFHLVSRELTAVYGPTGVVDALLTIAAGIGDLLESSSAWPAQAPPDAEQTEPDRGGEQSH